MAGQAKFLLLVLFLGWLTERQITEQTVAAPPAVTKPAKPPATPAKPAPAEKVLVLVNGAKITDADLDRLFQTRQVPAAQREELRRPLLEQLIDARLIEGYLAARDTAATKEQLEDQVERVREFAGRNGADPKQALSAAGFTDDLLKREFALPLAWKRHMERTVTAKKLREHFDAHRAEFDGTLVRASQIVIKAGSDAEPAKLKAAEDKLRQVRSQIVQKMLTFADAARQNSDGPSREKGGDVGFFPYRGKMPEDFSRVAFGLKSGEISDPFRTRFGVHLCTVTDRKPGDLSLEDVREQVLAHFSLELWRKTVAELRATARIEWKIKSN